MKAQLARGRWYKNGNDFSTGHLECLPKWKRMIDIDKMKLRADLTIRQENSVFVEYDVIADELDLQALFSLKHRQALLNASSNKNAFDFVENIKNRVLRAMARKLGCRLFLVFHGDNGCAPFDIHEVDVMTGVVVKRSTISGHTESAWQKAWTELNLL